ncbi:btaf1 RNA polymerase II, B-TFIID transcription factor-associated, 170kDa [Cymbomonas tetramitiformis]|uniref:Btaf1 RNA polymerase II, B-TFIID transcription factor-associated, 170kDa n=1 Tax=Cymbomonas tetramitiformis TaxID=36881 RepID=A0AAE0FE66_9CHLO|nr:btaf1 RNA polymerase II, B-TFIID transcription factor-associated, 170kDa [Cymbomonas tetramitiformis]
MIKNAKSRLSAACRQVRARHRLLLSGTPLQNNVLELWSLFDFLMPGFLGSEKEFQSTYGRALQAKVTRATNSKQMEAGMLALDALHKKVMPFMLRRTKDQVLKDLPPKIIQDVFCELSPMQRFLYEQFSTSNACRDVQTDIGTRPQLSPAAPASCPREGGRILI